MIHTPEWHGILMKFYHEVDQTQREQQMQNWLAEQLSPYFRIGREVTGISARGGNRVRIDLLCKAREKIVTRTGLTSQPFGIEAKYILGWKEDKAAKCSVWAAQMMQYLHSKFWHKGQQEYCLVPAFILSAPSLPTVEPTFKEASYVMSQMGIGCLYFRPQRNYDAPKDCLGNDYETVFEIQMKAGAVYWSNVKGRTGIGIGKNARIDHPDFERDEKEFFKQKMKDNKKHRRDNELG